MKLVGHLDFDVCDPFHVLVMLEVNRCLVAIHVGSECLLQEQAEKSLAAVQGPANGVGDVVLILTKKLEERFNRLVMQIKLRHLTSAVTLPRSRLGGLAETSARFTSQSLCSNPQCKGK